MIGGRASSCSSLRFWLQAFLRVLVAFLLLSLSTTVVATDSFATAKHSQNDEATTITVEDPHLEEVQKIFAWINTAEGGYVTSKQRAQRLQAGDRNTPIVVLATENIAKDEVLVTVPWSHIITGENSAKDEDEKKDVYCSVVEKLAQEMKTANTSFYSPYVTYLNSEPDNQLPTQYSTKAKEWLNLILDYHAEEVPLRSPLPQWEANHQQLAPDSLTSILDTHWYTYCDGDPQDRISAKAATFLTQRADDYILIPAYDAYNHRNGDYQNVHANTTENEQVQVVASRDIRQGEQLFLSYNMCPQCGGRAWYGFGTAEMYRDYGFIEWFPQRWYYAGYGDYDYEENSMQLNQFDLYVNEQEGNTFELEWTHLTTDLHKLQRFRIFLRKELYRLKRIKNLRFGVQHNHNDQTIHFLYNWTQHDITDYEWMNINQFLDANIVALTIALDDLKTLSPSLVSNEEYHAVSPAKLSKLLDDGNHYDPLLKSEYDDLSYHKYTCDNRGMFDLPGYWDTELETHTYYSNLNYCESFWFKKADDELDVCSDVDDTIHVCSSYRPYSNEYLIHMAGRYIPQLKRVLFVGGGDSMILHEVLKYDNTIELIVGLEYDQTFTRKSFKHFKTDPYFNDPRVQWWFGDLKRSLSMLPKSYFGSFDIVVVGDLELSEQHAETKGLFDILKALVNPQTGIMVKNDMLLNRFEQEFMYAMEMDYDSPMICSQTLVLGSDGIDFFRAPLYDHGITGMNNLLVTTPYNLPDNRHEFMHDYRTTKQQRQQQGKIKLSSAHKQKQQPQQVIDSGILQIVNAENTTLTTTIKGTMDIYNIMQLMKDALMKVEGFTFVDGSNDDDDHVGGDIFKDLGLCLLVFPEGYIAGRIFGGTDSSTGETKSTVERERAYVGFDIHLWTMTYRIDEVKSALVDAVGSKDVSSYRIVAGGMHGNSEYWSSQDDSKYIGRPIPAQEQEESKNDDAKSGSRLTLDNDVASAIAIEETIQLTMSDEVTAVVVCGEESDSESCISLTVLESHEHVKNVIPIYECAHSDVASNNKGLIEIFYDCEANIVEELTERLQSDKLQMLVLDGTASHRMHQIFNSIFDTYETREQLLHSHSIALTWSNNEGGGSKKKEPWRREFLDRYRKQIHHDPVKMGEIAIHTTEASQNNESPPSYELRIVSTNNVDANYEFHKLESRIQNRLKLVENVPTVLVEVRTIHGGLYNYVPKGQHNPKQFFQKDYDNTYADEHFTNQITLGRQYVFQYVVDPAVKKLEEKKVDSNLRLDDIDDILYLAMISKEDKLIDPENLNQEKGAVTRQRYVVGDGGVLFVSCRTFNMIAVWDGREHVDVNLVVFEEEDSNAKSDTVNLADTVNKRIKEFSSLKDIAIDTQPRGVGRVVNFPEDFIRPDQPLEQYLPEEYYEEGDYMEEEEYDDEYGYEEKNGHLDGEL